MRKNLQQLFEENKRKNQISKVNRVKLVNTLALLIQEQYAGNATHTEIGCICEEVIGLFPCLKGANASIGYIVS